MNAGNGFGLFLPALCLGAVLLGPWDRLGAEAANAQPEPIAYELTRVQLTGYTDRSDAARDAEFLRATGIESQVLAHVAEEGFVVSAGIFRQTENIQAMESRLLGLGFGNVQRASLRGTANQHRTASTNDTERVSKVNAWVSGSGDPGRLPDTNAGLKNGSVAAERSSLGRIAAVGEQESDLGLVPTQPAGLGDWPSAEARTISGFYQNETSYTIGTPSHWQKWRHRLYLSGDGALNERTAWKVSGWAAYDPIFDLTNFYPSEVRADRQSEAMLRETYLDVTAGDWLFRLGRQHIVWGEMVGLFFADVVSAKDLREFVVRDFDLIRIPQWAARAEHFYGDLHAELVWIPYVTYDNVGAPGDDFFSGPLPVPGFETSIRPGSTPANTLENSSYGFRLSYLRGGWDVAGFYFRSHDLSPVFAREVRTEPEPMAIFRPEHRRMHQFGLTAARDVGRMAVVKAEAVYNRDRWFSVMRVDPTDGLVQQDFLDYIVGLDTVSAQGTQFNLQFFQRRFFDHDSGIIPDRIESGASIFLSDWFPALRLRPEFLFAYNLDGSDWLARPSVTWEPPGDWRVKVGADLFNGPADSLFGQFNDQDRIYVDLRWDF